MYPFVSAGVAMTLALLAGAASASPLLVVTLQSHRFSPAVITAPAGERIVVEVHNLDSTPEEFESYDLKVEKLIVGHGKTAVNLSPMKVGVYKFFGDYNPKSAVGILRVLPATKR